MKKKLIYYTLDLLVEAENTKAAVDHFQPPNNTGKNAVEELSMLIQLIKEGQIEVDAISVG